MPVLSDTSLPVIRHALAGRYEIETRIGRGGMGAVYLARDVRLDRPVALKVLPPEFAADTTRRARFLWEARTAAALSHPNIVPIHAVHEATDWVAFAMGYVAGETLAQRIARNGPLALDDGARVLREIGEALKYAHGCGVVHRDVKPENILLDTVTGHAQLSDFGIAHVSRDGRPAPGGTVVGTAAFMSPEQARGEPVDARSDLYSLGVVGFYVLSGRLPFEAVDDAALLALHIAEPAPALAEVAPRIPARLAQIVDRCLAKDPGERFPDAAALVRALDDAAEPAHPAPAVRAFLVRGAYLADLTQLHAAMTGLVLVPAAAASWLAGAEPTLRLAATSALGAALVLPAGVAVA
ncbi:MAG: serine/threonine-protein kinase, partial [Gemmatimonadales bacterium]